MPVFLDLGTRLCACIPNCERGAKGRLDKNGKDGASERRRKRPGLRRPVGQRLEDVQRCLYGAIQSLDALVRGMSIALREYRRSFRQDSQAVRGRLEPQLHAMLEASARVRQSGGEGWRELTLDMDAFIQEVLGDLDGLETRTLDRHEVVKGKFAELRKPFHRRGEWAERYCGEYLEVEAARQRRKL